MLLDLLGHFLLLVDSLGLCAFLGSKRGLNFVTLLPH